MLSKEQIRKNYINIRKKKYFKIKDKCFKPLLNFIARKQIKKISLYYPSNYEFDTLRLFQILKKRKIAEILLPVILKNNSMKFVSWKFSDPLIVNKFGFLEPEKNKKKITPDLVLAPILAFDKYKNRLGYGKGYYDRILIEYISKNPNIITIGLAFSFQKYKKIPISKYDVKLNNIFTEKGFY